MMHPKTDFLKYIGTPFEPFILPIIPAGATLKEDSKLTPDHLGKIPGKYYSGLKAWTGFYAWQASRANRFDLERWYGWQEADEADTALALALRTGEILAIDIDISDEVIAEMVTCLIIAMMGMPGAIRRRPGTGRRVLFYGHKPHTAPVSKSRIAFDILAIGEKAAVEVLGNGQQVVAEGPHAKGALHYWQDGIGLIEGYQTMADNLQTIESIDQMMVQLRNFIDGDEARFKRVQFRPPSASEAVDAIKIDNIMSPNIAKDQEMLARRCKRSTSTRPTSRAMTAGLRCSAPSRRRAPAAKSFSMMSCGRGSRITQGMSREASNGFKSVGTASLTAQSAPNMSTKWRRRLAFGRVGTVCSSASSTESRSLCLAQLPQGLVIVESQAHKAWRQSNPA